MSAAQLRSFQEKWGQAEYPPDTVSDSDLRKAGEQLEWQIPEDYAQAVLEAGLPRPMIALLDVIVDDELDIFDVSDFLNPDEIVERTKSRHEIGLPIHLVAFASDCSGNLFAFSRAPEAAPSEVWFWDHDFDETRKLSATFGQWLDLYLAI